MMNSNKNEIFKLFLSATAQICIISATTDGAQCIHIGNSAKIHQRNYTWPTYSTILMGKRGLK